MLANFLSKSKPINFIILLSLFFVLFTTVSYTLLFSNGFEFTAFFKFTTYLCLFLVIFFLFNFIVSKNKLTADNFYGYYIFTLIISCFLMVILTFKAMAIFIIYLFFCRRIYSLKSTKNILQKLFDSGFWLGILFVIEPFTAILGALIYMAVFLNHQIILNTILTPIIGFIVPLLLLFTYTLFIDKPYIFNNLFYFNSFENFYLFSENGLFGILSFLLTTTIISLFLKSPKVFLVNNSFRKNWILLLTNFCIAFIYALLIPVKNGSELLFLLFPISIIIANGIAVIKYKIVKNIFLLLLLLGAVFFTLL